MERPMLLLMGQEDKTYMLAAKNDNALRCLNCFGELAIISLKWELRKVFFGFPKMLEEEVLEDILDILLSILAKKNWYLLEIKEKVFGRYIEEEDKDYYKKKKDFGEVRFDKFITPFPF